LQSFLIGQPEFRQILQSPHMMQFRQRVIAACHIGPLDVEETQAYIEHRLKCAGSTGLPRILPTAYEAIFKASNGIPRRINSVCDRLLLFGYLSSKKEFDTPDVEEVAREIREETMGGTAQLGGFFVADDALSHSPYTQPNTAKFINHGDDPSALLASLNVQQLGERLARLERSMLQLEKINSATLTLLQQLVANGNQLAKPFVESEEIDA
jgi:general secretion pathway protein A